MTKPKINDTLPRFTIQMLNPLYTAVQIAAIRKGLKVYELMNKLLLIGAKEWSKTQPKKCRIDVNNPELEQARKMAESVD